jgi:Beta-lactamase
MKASPRIGALAAVATAVVLLIVLGSSDALGTGYAHDTSSERTARLQRIVRGLVAARAPGALAVVRTPTGIRRAASGFANLKPKVRLRATDRFRIASVTKTFVATVVLQLAAEKRLSLDDSVERWLSGLVPLDEVEDIDGGPSVVVDRRGEPVAPRLDELGPVQPGRLLAEARTARDLAQIRSKTASRCRSAARQSTKYERLYSSSAGAPALSAPRLPSSPRRRRCWISQRVTHRGCCRARPAIVASTSDQPSEQSVSWAVTGIVGCLSYAVVDVNDRRAIRRAAASRPAARSRRRRESRLPRPPAPSPPPT